MQIVFLRIEPCFQTFSIRLWRWDTFYFFAFYEVCLCLYESGVLLPLRSYIQEPTLHLQHPPSVILSSSKAQTNPIASRITTTKWNKKFKKKKKVNIQPGGRERGDEQLPLWGKKKKKPFFIWLYRELS